MKVLKPLGRDGYSREPYVAYASQSYTIVSGAVDNPLQVSIDIAHQPPQNWLSFIENDIDVGYVNESGEFVRGSSKNLISSSEFIGILSNSPANHSISQLCADDIDAKGTVYFNDKLTYNSNFHLDLEKIDAAKKPLQEVYQLMKLF